MTVLSAKSHPGLLGPCKRALQIPCGCSEKDHPFCLGSCKRASQLVQKKHCCKEKKCIHSQLQNCLASYELIWSHMRAPLLIWGKNASYEAKIVSYEEPLPHMRSYELIWVFAFFSSNVWAESWNVFLVMTRFFSPQKILALPFVWCSFKHFQKNLGPAKGPWDSKMGKGKPPAKAMKVKNVTLKRPAALNLGTVKDKNQPMSLEEKMESFGKKGNQDVQQFLDSLTKNQREALWQRFASARAALRDSTADDLWQSVAKGKGSDPQKKKLLGCFLQLGGDLKTKKDHYMKELVSYSKTFGFLAAKIFFSPSTCQSGWGNTSSQEWVPFQTILKRYGLQECMRRATGQHE